MQYSRWFLSLTLLFVLGGPRRVPAAQDDASTAQSPKTVRISTHVLQGDLIKHKDPRYPAEARAQHLAGGAVVLDVRVSAEGQVTEARAMSGPEVFREPAIAAVKTWTYRPYLLNGSAIEVLSTIVVPFRE